MTQLKKELGIIKEMYLNGDNIISKFSHEGLREAIMVSYDLQAGSYNIDDEKFPQKRERTSDVVSGYINELGDVQSILEVGVGEATNFARIQQKLTQPAKKSYGFDLSWSRIKYAKHHINKQKLKDVSLFVGDLFNSPLLDNSIDVVYTVHSLEPNGGLEKEALTELYRITNKYLLLFEPVYEFASSATKKHIDEHGYVKNLYSVSNELGFKVIEHKLLYESMHTNNNSGITIIEKNTDSPPQALSPLACPITNTPLEKIRGHYFSRESLLLYPVIDDIPSLLPDNAIIATHYLDELC